MTDIIAPPPSDALRSYRILKRLARSKDYTGAIKLCRKLLKAQPEDDVKTTTINNNNNNKDDDDELSSLFVLGTACENTAPATLVQLLLALGLNPNERDKFGYTPLTKAALSGCTEEVFALLLASGADASVKTFVGNTALHCAVISAVDGDVINVLLRHGAPVFARDNKGETPLVLAKRWIRRQHEGGDDAVQRALRLGMERARVLTLLEGQYQSSSRAKPAATAGSAVASRLPVDLIRMLASFIV